MSVAGVTPPLYSFESAIEDYRAALAVTDSKHIQEGLKRAEKLLKQSKKRDYYKILGVLR